MDSIVTGLRGSLEVITYILVIFSIGLILGKSFSEDDDDSAFYSAATYFVTG